MNKAIFIGNVGKDPEVKDAGGKRVAKFSVAVSDGFGDKKKTYWLNVIAWQKLAEVVEKYLKKGSKVLVEGRITTRDYEGKTYTDIVAEKLEFLDPKPAAEKKTEITDEDIPF